MKVLLINAVCGIRSTGRICTDIADAYEKDGHTVKIAYGRETVPEKYQKYAVRIGADLSVYWHAFMSELFNQRGFWSKKATVDFLKWAEEYNPDVLWLHNIHDYFINIGMLFDWIKSRPQMTVKWTQHDCWAFTGGCFHFQISNCEQWKNLCENCPQKNKYLPCRLSVHESDIFTLKKNMFSDVNNMEIIVVSNWLASLVKQSFLSRYPITVVHNSVDKNTFYPRSKDYFLKRGINEKIILGVASAWNTRKGLNDFVSLSEMLTSEYKIVLVGLNKKQIKKMPKNILCIERTNDIDELAQIYSSASVFVNPTYQDSFPTVNLEAQACGIPVITYRTGGSPETLQDGNGCVVDVGDVLQLRDAIINSLK